MTSLADAQKLVVWFNAWVFDNGKRSYQWPSGNVRITAVFPIVPKMGPGFFVGTGFDRNRGFGLPTNAGTLVVESNCRQVVTAFPGLP